MEEIPGEFMNKDKKRLESFEEIIKPVIKWLNDNCHPHTTIIVCPTSAELVEGVCGINTEEFLKD